MILVWLTPKCVMLCAESLNHSQNEQEEQSFVGPISHHNEVPHSSGTLDDRDWFVAALPAFD